MRRLQDLGQEMDLLKQLRNDQPHVSTQGIGTHHEYFSVSLGTPGPFRSKTTIPVLSPHPASPPSRTQSLGGFSRVGRVERRCEKLDEGRCSMVYSSNRDSPGCWGFVGVFLPKVCLDGRLPGENQVRRHAAAQMKPRALFLPCE